MPGKVIQSGSMIAPNRSLSEIPYVAPLPFIVATKGRAGRKLPHLQYDRAAVCRIRMLAQGLHIVCGNRSAVISPG